MTIEINGIKYQQIQKKNLNKTTSKVFALAMMFAYMPSAMGGGGVRRRPQVDIVNEFQLIQDKKSKLSKIDRDWVEREFHKNFKVVV